MTGKDAGVAAFTWDDAGNMTGRAVPGAAGGARSVQSLAWDAEGELASVGTDTNGDGDTADTGEATAGGQYVYTADGDRLVRHQGTGQDKTTTVYLPGGQEVTVAHATGGVTAVRYYAFAGKTIAMRTGMLTDQIITITPDHHGTGQVQITNLTNTVTRRHTDPYGASRGTAGPVAPDQGAAGGWAGDHGYLDKPADATGLTAVGARMYDPCLGAFISVDPVMDLADPQQWHGYAYSHNSPVTYSDPTGLREVASGDPRNDSQEQIASAARHSSGGTGRGPAVDPPVWCYAPPYVPPTAWETYSEATVTVAQKYGHDYIDLVGLIPGAGIPADVANASWYYSEGDNLNGTLSAIGVIPVVGEAVVAGKWVFKGGKWAWDAIDAANAAPKALEASARVAPWADGSVSRLSRDGEVVYRVWGGGAERAGSWVTPVTPLSSAMAREGLALPAENAALYVSRVSLPAGTRMQVGTAAGAFGQPGGWPQVQLIDRIPQSSFGKGVPLQ